MNKTEAVVQRDSVKKVFLEISQNSHENTCATVSFLQLYWKKKKILAKVFSYESCEISKNVFFTENYRVTASGKT